MEAPSALHKTKVIDSLSGSTTSLRTSKTASVLQVLQSYKVTQLVNCDKLVLEETGVGYLLFGSKGVWT